MNPKGNWIEQGSEYGYKNFSLRIGGNLIMRAYVQEHESSTGGGTHRYGKPTNNTIFTAQINDRIFDSFTHYRTKEAAMVACEKALLEWAQTTINVLK